jgi:hypothetical protein
MPSFKQQFLFPGIKKSASARSATYKLRPAMQGGSALPRKAAKLADLPLQPQ